MDRYIDAQHRVSTLAEFARPDPAAAAGIHHQTVSHPVLPQQAQQAGRGIAGKAGKTGIVDVGQIAIIGRHELLTKEFLIDLSGQDKIALGQSIDLMCICLHIHSSPT